jgi:uncharacterized surface protein with fasciclin (FAS1) repeats
LLGVTLALSALSAACGGAGSGGSTTEATTPPQAATVEPAGEETQTPPSLIEALEADGSFTTFVHALQVDGLAPLLAKDGPFTVFAPTDAAFASLPDGLLDELLSPAGEPKLTRLLEYHIAPGRLVSSVLEDDTRVNTLRELGVSGCGAPQSTSLLVRRTGAVTVDGVTVIETDLDASNGVIHVVDAVLGVDSC